MLEEQLIGGAAFFFCGGLILWSLFTLGRMAATRHWHTTTGTITGAYIETDSDGDSTIQRPRVEYAYLVDGEPYFSRRWRMFNESEGHFYTVERGRRVPRYRRGSEVTVYYDPRRPQNATLQRPLFDPLVPVLLLFGIMGVAGAVVYLRGLQ
jgi:hypothetical protein